MVRRHVNTGDSFKWPAMPINNEPWSDHKDEKFLREFLFACKTISSGGVWEKITESSDNAFEPDSEPRDYAEMEGA